MNYKDKFILKGGMLIAALVGVDMRSTINMDATIKSYTVTEESIKEAFEIFHGADLDQEVVRYLKNDKVVNGLYPS